MLLNFTQSDTGNWSTFVTRGTVVITPNVSDGDDDHVTVMAVNAHPELGSVTTDADGNIIYTPSLSALHQIGGVATRDVPITLNTYVQWSAEGTISAGFPVAPGATAVDITGLSTPGDEIVVTGIDGVLKHAANGNLTYEIDGVTYHFATFTEVQSVQVTQKCQNGKGTANLSVYAQSSLSSFLDISTGECSL